MIIKRIRKSDVSTNLVYKEVLGNFITEAPLENKEKYIALHLWFEIEMVAYSLCQFGGGEKEWKRHRRWQNVSNKTSPR